MRARSTLIRDLCRPDVVTAAQDVTLEYCAKLMREHHVGSVIIVQPSGRKPIGIITDRDLVIECAAMGLAPESLTVGEVMTTPVATVAADDDILDALAKMRETGTRRLPVVGQQGELVGILAADDLLGVLAEQIDELARIIAAEQTREEASRPPIVIA
jgi:CBS domain-containing protein